MENPPKKYFRLSVGAEVRLRWAYIIKCVGMVKNERGEVTEIHCTYDPATLGSNPTDRKIKGTIHWVSAQHAIPAEIRLYEHLFPMAKPDEAEDWKENINPNSLANRARLCRTIARECASRQPLPVRAQWLFFR